MAFFVYWRSHIAMGGGEFAKLRRGGEVQPLQALPAFWIIVELTYLAWLKYHKEVIV
jgi:hypothetical protein